MNEYMRLLKELYVRYTNLYQGDGCYHDFLQIQRTEADVVESYKANEFDYRQYRVLHNMCEDLMVKYRMWLQKGVLYK